MTRKRKGKSAAKTQLRPHPLFPGKVHPWRLCPAGEHWVVTHPMQVPPSKTHPEGYVTTRHEHCARNPSGKDQLYPDEIQEIARNVFSKIKNRPCSIDLGFKGKGSKYDDLISGWTQYWNDVLHPNDPLDLNVVKALVASESGFKPDELADKKNSNSARGLMQITNATRKILGDEKGEIKDHYLTVTKNDLNDPNVNICTGIRWLFHKRDLASSKLGHQASWLEAIGDYKGASTAPKKRADELMARFQEKLNELKKCLQ